MILVAMLCAFVISYACVRYAWESYERGASRRDMDWLHRGDRQP